LVQTEGGGGLEAFGKAVVVAAESEKMSCEQTLALGPCSEDNGACCARHAHGTVGKRAGTSRCQNPRFYLTIEFNIGCCIQTSIFHIDYIHLVLTSTEYL
jgi:hypothetical protein